MEIIRIISMIPLSVKVCLGTSFLMLAFKKQLVALLKKSSFGALLFGIGILALIVWVAIS